MGRKRGRTQSIGRKAPGPEAIPHHDQNLTDEVRQVRDTEFAASKKQEARAKRRRLSEEAEDAAIRREAQSVKKAAKTARGSQVKKVDARREGLLMWKRAAERRRTSTKTNEYDADKDTPLEGVEEGLTEQALEKGSFDPKISERIREEAREQRKEIRQEELKNNKRTIAEKNAAVVQALHAIGEDEDNRVNLVESSDDDDNDSENDDTRSLAHTEVGPMSNFGDEEDQDLDFLDGTKITEEEELALSMFGNAKEENDANKDAQETGEPKIMLADIILEKIREKEEADARAAAIAADPERAARDKKIAEVYGLVGNIMSRYRSGKVPKAFKVIPKLSNWEDIMYLTRPDEWTPASVYVATRLFASNLTAKQVVRFYSDILLPKCLEDIAENKKLNYHLYRSLGKAVYKPDAFIKGILFPLCEDASCTFRQATIIGSAVSKVSIPMLHSAAALLYISQLPYNTTNMIIMTALLEKKYALPYRALDAVVESFMKMKDDPRPLPLIWHKCLIAFAQRYKMELTFDQKEKLKILMRAQTHHAITPEIRRELFSSKNRGDLMDPDANTIARNIANASAMTDV